MKYYIDTLELTKNCTYTENAVEKFLESSVANSVINDVIVFYENSAQITENEDNKNTFLFSNMIFSNLCRSKKGFAYLFNKIGLIKFLNIAKVSDNIDILTAVMETLVNYFQNETTNNHSELIDDILIVIKKCLIFEARTLNLISCCYMLSGLIYNFEIMDKMIPLSIKHNFKIRFGKFDRQ